MSQSHDTPSLSTDAASETGEQTPWPERAFPFADTCAWVTAALPLPDSVTVRVATVYANYADAPDLRVTARLALTNAEVVFKGNRFPLLAGSGRAHALLSRYCTGMVPHVLAWEEDSHAGSSRLLLQPFEGRAVEASGEPSLLVETARTLAKIQNAVAASGEVEGIGLPRVMAGDIPTRFDAVQAHIEAHFSAWQEDEDSTLSKALGSPAANVREVLGELRPQIEQCAVEVTALELPLTIDHGDLHGGNAIIQADGSILIYDWETATLGCPLFSVEKLLVAAWRMDAKLGSGGPWGYMPNTPTQALVRDAYLDTLSLSRTIGIRKTSFAAAMAIAVVKEMHTEIVWANQMGWQDGNPEWTAQLIRRFRHHLTTWNETK